MNGGEERRAPNKRGDALKHLFPCFPLVSRYPAAQWGMSSLSGKGHSIFSLDRNSVFKAMSQIILLESQWGKWNRMGRRMGPKGTGELNRGEAGLP